MARRVSRVTISPEPIPDEVLNTLPAGFHVLWLERHNDLLVARALQADLDIVDVKALEALFK